MSAWDTTGPSTLLTKRELADAQKRKRMNQPGNPYYSTPSAHPFCTRIPTRAEQDRTNSIKGR